MATRNLTYEFDEDSFEIPQYSLNNDVHRLNFQNRYQLIKDPICDFLLYKPTDYTNLDFYYTLRNYFRSVEKNICKISKLPIPPIRMPLQTIQQSNIFISNDTRKKPTSPKTILKKSRIIKMGDLGRCLHYGIESSILKYLSNVKQTFEYITMTVGAYVMKANAEHHHQYRFFMLLGDISYVGQTKKIPSFVISVFEGNFTSLTIGNKILRPFVIEMIKIRKFGIALDNGTKAKLYLKSFIVDPVANSLLTCTAFPGSAYSCSKCTQPVKLLLRSNQYVPSYPNKKWSITQRQDKDFILCENKYYHMALPILFELGIEFHEQIIIDSRHTIFLGIVQKMVNLWLHGELKYRLNEDSLDKIDAMIFEIAFRWNNGEMREIKGIRDIDNWDEYDAQLFLVLFSVKLLRKKLPTEYLLHFKKLCLAMIGMLRGLHVKNKTNKIYCDTLLDNFVSDFALLYGEDKIDYNIHNLLHIEHYSFNYKYLEDASGFLFRNILVHFENAIKQNRTLTLESIRNKINQLRNNPNQQTVYSAFKHDILVEPISEIDNFFEAELEIDDPIIKTNEAFLFNH